MSQLLLIQNHGEAPVEGYTVLGYSSTRNCGIAGTVGQFGSGSKHGINLCLRNGLRVWVYCGKTCLEFGLEKETINDGLRNDEVYHVTYRKGNGEFKRAGWILDFGVLDWDDLGMAVREFVSNAIDRTIKEEGDIQEARNVGRLSVKLVEENDRRAKAEYTRIYIEVNDDIRAYFAQLGKKFLHFSDNPENAAPGLIEKKTTGPAQIYRAGVFIRELAGEALFDYNFTVDEIKIDECRNSSDYVVKAACARKFRDASSDKLSHVMSATLNCRSVVEADFDADYMTNFNGLTQTQQERWKTAWESAAGPEAIVCDNKFSSEFVEKKGHNPRQVPTNWMKAIRSAGVRSAMEILNVDEQRGRSRVETTVWARKAVDWAWELFELANLVGGTSKPEVFCFQEIGTAESKKSGYKNHEGVHFHIDISNDGLNNELKKTALEELTHHITGSGDSTRDFQNFLLDTIVSLT